MEQTTETTFFLLCKTSWKSVLRGENLLAERTSWKNTQVSAWILSYLQKDVEAKESTNLKGLQFGQESSDVCPKVWQGDTLLQGLFDCK